jgi:hypothetical protein
MLIDEDTDNDGSFDFADGDDDGDGIPTIEEDYNGNGNPLDDDTNNNGIPDFREAAVALHVSGHIAGAFTIYPNPSKGTVNVDFGNTPEANATLVICDVTGKQVMEFSDLSQILSVSGLQTGIYIVKLASGRNTTIKKLIVL